MKSVRSDKEQAGSFYWKRSANVGIFPPRPSFSSDCRAALFLSGGVGGLVMKNVNGKELLFLLLCSQLLPLLCLQGRLLIADQWLWWRAHADKTSSNADWICNSNNSLRYAFWPSLIDLAGALSLSSRTRLREAHSLLYRLCECVCLSPSSLPLLSLLVPTPVQCCRAPAFSSPPKHKMK